MMSVARCGRRPKCFFPFLVWVKAPTAPKTYVEGDEATHSRWYAPSEIRDMVADGRIGDMVTIMFLMCAGGSKWATSGG